MTTVRSNWRDDGEYCIRAECGAKGAKKVSAAECRPLCRIKFFVVMLISWITRTKSRDDTHFLCGSCRRCRKRRVVLKGDFNWGVTVDGEIWHESTGMFVRDSSGRFLFYRRTIHPARRWTVPSGHVDTDDETTLTAALRELKEEVEGLPEIPADAVRHVATEDIVGDSCRRGADTHHWHAFLAVLDYPIDLEKVRVRGEGKDPELLSLAEVKRKRLTYPVRYVIDRHGPALEG